jgi:hypothetical protein
VQQEKDGRSLGDLLKDLSSETRELLRKEIELAKVEVAEKGSRLVGDVRALAIGGALVLAGALALLDGAIRGATALLAQVVALEVAVWLAPLLVGSIMAGVGYGHVTRSLERLKRRRLAPEKTGQTLQENAQWIRAKIGS